MLKTYISLKFKNSFYNWIINLLVIKMAYCRFCGGKISENANFCNNCGKTLSKEQNLNTKDSPELYNSNSVKSYVREPQSPSENEILEIVKIVGDTKNIKNTLLFYDDYLIIANLPKSAADRLLDVYSGAVVGDLLGGFLGSKVGKSFDKDRKKKVKESFSLTPQEVLDSDPGNLLINYRDINEIKFEKKILRLPKILIITPGEEHKVSIAEEKFFKEIKSSIKSILKDKVTD